MAHVVKLRVKDTTTSTGTGAKVLARSTLLNFRTFDAVMANGDTCDAIVVNRSANQWEHSSWTIAGVGGEPVLTRLEFKESSTGTPVHFTEGVKDVLMLYPVAGKLDFTARTLKLAPNIIDGTPGTASAFRFYDDGNGWIAGIGISPGSVDIRSGEKLNLWSGQTGNQRNTVRINQNGLAVAAGADVAAGIDPQAVLHVVNRGGAPSAIITTGTNTAVRIGPNGVTSAIEGVDYTGLAAWRPLFINGDVVILGAQGYEAMRVTANRNVVIGTTVESAKLAIGLDGVADPNNYGKVIQITRGPSGGQQIAFIRNGAQVISLGYMPGNSTFGFGLGITTDASFWPNYLAIGANGNIGIGTVTPNARLSFGTSVGLAGLYLYDDGNAGASGFGISPNTLNIFANALSTTSAAIAFGKYDKTTFTEWVRIVNGFMGLGTAGPTHLLDVVGSTVAVTEKIARISNAGGSRYLQFGVLAYSGNQAPYIQSHHTNSDANPWNLLLNPNGGAVGIGTSQPAESLHVSSPSNGGRLFVGEAGGTRRGLLIGAATGGELAAATPYTRIESFNYGTGVGMPLVLNPGGGYVGIGTATPIFGLSLKTYDTNVFLAAGNTKGVRIMTGATIVSIEGVDATGVGSYQPLVVKGSTLDLASGSGAKMFITDNGVGIGGVSGSGFLLDVSSNPELKVRFKNWGTTGRAMEFYQDVGGRSVYRGVNYDGQYLHEYGTGVTTRYSDFANHLFRVPGSGDRLIINTTGVGIGMTPAAILSVMSPTVTTGFATLADFHMPNAVGGATHTRFSIMQLGVSHIGLEVANQANAKGYLGLQPYGGLVTVGPYLNTGDQFSVQADYDGHLNSTIYNHSIGNSAAAKFNMTVRDRHVSRMLYYKDQWMQEKGIGVTQFYSEFDWHSWRNNAGVDKMTLNVNCHLWLANTTDPGVPGTGGYIYISGGALKYRGSGGTITTLAPA